MNGLKSGLGMQKFSDGSIYYGNFYLGFMHGEGVMVQKDSIYQSGKLHFGSFNHGLILYQNNKTMVYTRKLRDGERNKVHLINIVSGKTWCAGKTGNLSEINCIKEKQKRAFDYVDLRDEFYRKNYIQNIKISNFLFQPSIHRHSSPLENCCTTNTVIILMSS